MSIDWSGLGASRVSGNACRVSRYVFTWLVFCCLLGMLYPQAAMAEAVPGKVAGTVYSFAVVPQYTPLSVHRQWQPFITQLSKDTGVQFRLRVYSNFNKFLDDLSSGRSDFAYMAPYHLVLARRAQGYEPLLRDGGNDLVGLVVVKKGSPYHDIHDLDGKQIDFPSPNAFAASLYLRAYLREQVKIDFTSRYLGNHDNVYRHVVHGFSVAGGGVNTTLARQPQGLQDNLRVLFQVPAVASHPVAIHPRVSGEVRSKVIDTITGWADNPQRQAMLKAVQLQHPVAASYEKDYYSLEELNLEKYLIDASGF